MARPVAVVAKKVKGRWQVTCPTCKTVIDLGTEKPAYYTPLVECPECGQSIQIVTAGEE